MKEEKPMKTKHLVEPELRKEEFFWISISLHFEIYRMLSKITALKAYTVTYMFFFSISNLYVYTTSLARKKKVK
jgi:hypothetical protein